MMTKDNKDFIKAIDSHYCDNCEEYVSWFYTDGVHFCEQCNSPLFSILCEGYKL